MAKSAISRGVNFLPQGTYLTETELQRRQTVISVSFIILAVYLVIVVGVFITSFLFKNQKNQLDQSINSLTGQIQALKPLEIAYFTQTDRLKLITPLLSPVMNSRDLPNLLIKLKNDLPRK